jgi:hypothetical protein
MHKTRSKRTETFRGNQQLRKAVRWDDDDNEETRVPRHRPFSRSFLSLPVPAHINTRFPIPVPDSQEEIPYMHAYSIAKRTERGVMRRKRSYERCLSTFRPSPVPEPLLLCGWVVSEQVKAARAFARFAFVRVEPGQVIPMSACQVPLRRAAVVWCARRYFARSGAGSFYVVRRCRQSCGGECCMRVR